MLYPRSEGKLFFDVVAKSRRCAIYVLDSYVFISVSERRRSLSTVIYSVTPFGYHNATASFGEETIT